MLKRLSKIALSCSLILVLCAALVSVSASAKETDSKFVRVSTGKYVTCSPTMLNSKIQQAMAENPTYYYNDGSYSGTLQCVGTSSIYYSQPIGYGGQYMYGFDLIYQGTVVLNE